MKEQEKKRSLVNWKKDKYLEGLFKNITSYVFFIESGGVDGFGAY